MTTMLRAAGVLKGTRSKDEAEVRSQLIQDMLQHSGESTFVRVGNNTYGLRYYPAESPSPLREARGTRASEASTQGVPENPSTTPSESPPESGRMRGSLLSIKGEDVAPRPSPIKGGGEQTSSLPSREREDVLSFSHPRQRENTHPLSPPRERARVRGNRDDTNESDEALLRRISNLSNQRFERFIVVLLASIGMTDVVIINRLRPGELDIHASMDIAEVMDINFSIQALNWHRDVHGGDIQLLRGGMRFGDHGLIITTSDFQRGAIEEANRPGATPIATINGTQLAKISQTRGASKVLGSS